MEDEAKSKRELIRELRDLRERAAMLEADAAERNRKVAALSAGSEPEAQSAEFAGLYEQLARLAQEVGTAPNLHSVFRALCSFAVMMTPSHGLFASLYDQDSQLRSCVYAWSEGEEIDVTILPPMPPSNSPHSRAVATGQPIVTDDLQAVLAGQPRVDLAFDLDPRQPRSSLAVPMAVMGRVIGGFEVQSPELAAYQERHVIALQLAANLAAIAIENVQLIERERQMRVTAEVSEQRFRALVLNASDLILVVDGAGVAQYVSPSVARMLGYRPNDLIRRKVWRYLHFEDRRRAAKLLREARLEATPQAPAEFRVRRATGDWCYLEVITSNLLQDPSVGGIVINARDITERKRGEHALRFLAEASNQLAGSLDYQTTLQKIAQLALSTLADWCIVDIIEADQSINRLAVAAAEASKEELLHQLQQRYPPDWDSPQPAAVALRAGAPQLIPSFSQEALAAMCRDDEHFQLIQRLAPRSAMVVPLIARGNTIGVITLATSESGRQYNVEDLMLAQELARRSAIAIDNARLYQEAKTAVEVRDQFLSIASHELKTPLTPLLIHTDALQRRARRDPTTSLRDMRAVQVIAEQAQRLNRLIETLLDLSRIQSGRLTIERKPMDLARLTRRIVEEMQPVLVQHTMSVSGDTSIVINGDALRLEQVLQNLLQNAIKYSPAGGRIIVEVGCKADQAYVAVVDEGIGIPVMAQPYLFQQFYRASNVQSEQISGFGIGLYVVHEIVALHGGQVDISSVEGKGSTFTVRLPLQSGLLPVT